MKKTLHTIFFDAGGTLVGADNIFDWLCRKMWQGKIPRDVWIEEFISAKSFSEREFLDVKGIMRHICRNIADRYHLENAEEKAADIYKTVFSDTVYVYEGVYQALQDLRAHGVRLIVVSDADADVLLPQFETLRISRFFEKKIISSDVRAYKPSEKMVDYIKRTCDVRAPGFLFAGDSEDDVITAQKLEIDSVLIGKTGSGPTFTISSFTELMQVLRENYILAPPP